VVPIELDDFFLANWIGFKLAYICNFYFECTIVNPFSSKYTDPIDWVELVIITSQLALEKLNLLSSVGTGSNLQTSILTEISYAPWWRFNFKSGANAMIPDPELEKIRSKIIIISSFISWAHTIMFLSLYEKDMQLVLKFKHRACV
jgi:hypothetical protein